MRRLYLVGMMGTGKTTIGKELAKHLKMDFYDLDEYIEGSLGRKISDVFSCEGEPYFRDVETKALMELAFFNNAENQNNNYDNHDTSTNCDDNNINHAINDIGSLNGIVIATGGGAFEREQNRSLMFKTGTVIWLKTSPQEIAKRLAKDNSRPLLQNTSDEELLDRINTLLEKRQSNYQLATIHINTESKTLNEIVKEIAGAIHS